MKLICFKACKQIYCPRYHIKQVTTSQLRILGIWKAKSKSIWICSRSKNILLWFPIIKRIWTRLMKSLVLCRPHSLKVNNGLNICHKNLIIALLDLNFTNSFKKSERKHKPKKLLRTRKLKTWSQKPWMTKKATLVPNTQERTCFSENPNNQERPTSSKKK